MSVIQRRAFPRCGTAAWGEPRRGAQDVTYSPPLFRKGVRRVTRVHRTEHVSAVFANYPTGVVVLTALSPDGDLTALPTQSFAVVSAAPPIVSFVLPAGSALESAESICVNVLAADQERLCRRLAAAVGESLDEAGWSPAPSGAPIIDGVVSWLDCRPLAIHEAGPNRLVVAAVEDLHGSRNTMPLMHFQRGYGSFVAGTLVTSQQPESFTVGALAEAARDTIEWLARDLGAECSLIVPLRGEAVFVATANYSGATRPTRLGLRSPIVAPLGALFVDTPGAPTQEEWLAHLGDEDRDLRAAALAQLRRTRERNWSISLHGEYTPDELDDAVAAYTSPFRTSEDEHRLLEIVRRMSSRHEIEELAAGESYDILHLAVPVHDVAGTVVGALRLGDLPRRADVEEIMLWLSQLRDASRRVERDLVAG